MNQGECIKWITWVKRKERFSLSEKRQEKRLLRIKINNFQKEKFIKKKIFKVSLLFMVWKLFIAENLQQNDVIIAPVINQVRVYFWRRG